MTVLNNQLKDTMASTTLTFMSSYGQHGIKEMMKVYHATQEAQKKIMIVLSNLLKQNNTWIS